MNSLEQYDVENKASSLIEKLSFATRQGKQTIHLETIEKQLKYSALSINVAGRLRMLLQKSCKEFYMILAQLDINESQRQIRRTKSSFENSIKILLRNAKKGIFTEDVSQKVIQQLQDIQAQWLNIKTILDLTETKSTPPSNKEIRFLMQREPLLLEDIESLVSLLENFAYRLHLDQSR